MENSTRFLIVFGVFIVIGGIWFFSSAGQSTTEMNEDRTNLAMVKTLEAEANKAENGADYELAAERLGEAMKYFDKLHARPVSVEQHFAEIKDRRFRLGVKAEAEKKRQEETAEQQKIAREETRQRELQQREEQKRQEEEKQRLAEQEQQVKPEPAPVAETPEQAEVKAMEADLKRRANQFKDKLAVATTQPATFNKYYNLMKNQFMKDDDDGISLIPDSLDDAIVQIKRHAADEKDAVDQEIQSLTEGIRMSDSQRKGAEAAARENSKAAREAGKKTVYNHWRFRKDDLGRTVDSNVHQHVNTYAAQAQASARQQAANNKAQAGQYEGNVNASRARLGDLKKRSAALRAVASPYVRELPPEQFWLDLPANVQEQLARVGISQDEFRGVIKQVGYKEEEFIEIAFILDQQEKDDDVLIGKLRKWFRSKMPARENPGQNS